MQFVPVVDINQRYLMLTTPSKARGWMKKIGHTLVIFFVVLLLTLTSPLLGIAQNPTQPENKIDGFPVMLDGKTLFFIRRGVSSFSAEERANTITRRIERIAQNDSIPIENLTIEQIPDDNSLYLSIDQEVILTVTERDAKAYRSTPEVLAQQALQKIQVAIAQYRQDRKPEQLLKNIIYTVIATFSFLIISFAVIKISGKLFPFIRRLIESLTPGIQIGNIEIVSSSKISFFWLRVLRMIRLFILFLLTFNYATFVLRLFPWTRVFGESILGYFSRSLELVLSSIGKYLPNAFIIAIIIFVTYYLIRLIKPFFTAIERGNLVIPGFYTDWAKPTYNLLLVIIIALAAIVAFPYLPGFDSPAFRGVSVFLGLLLSLGSTSAIANVIGGIILIYTRAFRIGDHIQVGDVIGDLIEKNFLVIRICTPTNKIITIPNSSLLSSNVINFSISSRELNRNLIIQTTITLGYDLPWRKAHKTLIEAALETDHILKEPAPFVLQTSLDNFYISYQLNAYTNQPNLMVIIYSELHQNIQDKCNEAGIEILSPSYTSLRDGNTTTIPENYLPSDYAAPPFRVQSSDNQENNTF
ncbi:MULTISPECIES: mechanosensitive ion channel family protein [unclassified Microcystis]|jgi:small-conductance mechanosensitive channel|uniref:mechanosensitive ion channel family protein n=1 Tax=unclassified Microcystis TaxID=2643300 RepID=UPI00257ACD2F|nr:MULTISPECIES: mechanosensitive ion channel family protein [unclassified Microcystis]MCA2927488.1 mechanosensitive ion channel family protein [Microcystis sp. M020S1]MCA2935039.1 mechanosensitive ion channel family protein [Microcystis sp. M015S1]MCU7244566.1 mechanosensitive ion channel family protein [Microcystis aeruginosa WS75]MCA2618375.1 mechanosensitive ion channel family protein [Microcystis sp. M099S2]MCA2651942.1 mechanosensitive ion channel family protein [Microcystis sp. M065S2]